MEAAANDIVARSERASEELASKAENLLCEVRLQTEELVTKRREAEMLGFGDTGSMDDGSQDGEGGEGGTSARRQSRRANGQQASRKLREGGHTSGDNWISSRCRHCRNEAEDRLCGPQGHPGARRTNQDARAPDYSEGEPDFAAHGRYWGRQTGRYNV